MRLALWPGEPSEHAAEIDAFLKANPLSAVFVSENPGDGRA